MYRSRATSAGPNRRYPDGERAGWISPSDSRNRILDTLTSGNSAPKLGQHLTDAERSPGRLSVHAPTWAPPPPRSYWSRGPVRNTSRNLPIWTSSPPFSGALLDALPVDVGAVEAADVAHGETVAPAVELGVPPGDRHVVEEDVAVRVPPGRGDVVVEQEPAARVRAAPDHQQRGTRRQGVLRRRLIGELVVVGLGQVTAQRDRRGGFAGALGPPVAPASSRNAGRNARRQDWPDRSVCSRCSACRGPASPLLAMGSGRGSRRTWPVPGARMVRAPRTDSTLPGARPAGPCATRGAPPG